MALKAKHKDTAFSVGDTVAVHQKIIEQDKEKDKERIQIFEGLVIGIKGRQENKSFTVRRIGVNSVGVERIWPLQSPMIKKIEVKRQGKVRRAKLYYLRNRIGSQALRVQIRQTKTKKVAEVKKAIKVKKKAKVSKSSKKS
ncbi:50S ribosomal protein L19 [Patescibacteria group bacterium]|nr:50S ribosomal protein L19 [Patescibacteria group bacterium]MBU1931587.1 50S ribosomal protein L19 [Patescibacteria group bacterium]